MTHQFMNFVFIQLVHYEFYNQLSEIMLKVAIQIERHPMVGILSIPVVDFYDIQKRL